MKYVLLQQMKEHQYIGGGVDATSKPSYDVVKICQSMGYTPLRVSVPSLFKIFGHRVKGLSWIISGQRYLRIMKRIRINKGDTILVQYPLYDYRKGIISHLKNQGGIVKTLVHDVNPLRFNSKETIEDVVSALNQGDNVIVHTEAMRDVLMSKGLTVPTEILHLFDYLTESPMLPIESVEHQKKNIAFAGNLSKGKFVGLLMMEIFPTVLK